MNLLSIIKNKYRAFLLTGYEKFPELLSIELTTACNSSCIMCPRPSMKRRIAHMDEAIFRKVLDDCRKKPVKKINFFWFGDPFCNPKTPEFLRIARRALPGVRFYISTNAGLLDRSKTDLILKEGLLDVVNFDIDGAKKETHESIRRGVDFDLVVKNVRYFIDRRRQLGLKKPQVRVTMIRMAQNKDEVELFRRFWKPLADKVEINDYNTWMGTVEDRNTGPALKKSKTGGWHHPCIHAWNEMVVSADGTAGLCCLDFNLTAPLGRVLDRSIEEIWRGPELAAYREKLKALKYSGIPCCKHCNAHIYSDRLGWRWAWK